MGAVAVIGARNISFYTTLNLQSHLQQINALYAWEVVEYCQHSFQLEI